MASWADHVTSLREITGKTILAALDDQPPVTARNLLSALTACSRPSHRSNRERHRPQPLTKPHRTGHFAPRATSPRAHMAKRHCPMRPDRQRNQSTKRYYPKVHLPKGTTASQT